MFFGAKLLCDKIVTDVVSYRNIGDKDEFVRISVLGAVRKQSFSVEPSGAWEAILVFSLSVCYRLTRVMASWTQRTHSRYAAAACL